MGWDGEEEEEEGMGWDGEEEEEEEEEGRCCRVLTGLDYLISSFLELINLKGFYYLHIFFI